MNKWLSGRIGCDYYHDENGKILGKLIRSSLSDETYYAEVEDGKIGEYVSKESAKAAVEQAIDGITIEAFDYADSDVPVYFAQDADFAYDYSDYDDVKIDLSDINFNVTTNYVEEEAPKKKKKK